MSYIREKTEITYMGGTIGTIASFPQGAPFMFVIVAGAMIVAVGIHLTMIAVGVTIVVVGVSLASALVKKPNIFGKEYSGDTSGKYRKI